MYKPVKTSVIYRRGSVSYLSEHYEQRLTRVATDADEQATSSADHR